MKILAIISFFLLAASLPTQAQETEPPATDPPLTEIPEAPEAPVDPVDPKAESRSHLHSEDVDIIKAKVASNAVSLIWEPSDLAEQYMLTVKPVSVYYEGEHDPADIITTTTKDYQVIIGSLKPNTLYSCSVALADSNGTAFYYDYAYVTFKTLLPKVTDLKVFYVGENYIELTWTASEHAIGYSVVVKDQDHNLFHADVVVVGSKATISGLEPVNYYFVYVIVLGPEGEEGDTAVIQARTDGEGVKVHLWEGHDGDIHGGQVTIFRPMKIPAGPYAIKVNFGCSLASVKIWNAKFIPDGSDLKSGMVYMEQRKHWQKEKSLIGIIFYLDMYSEHFAHCKFMNTSVTAVFGNEASSAAGIEAMPTENVDCPVEWYEWRTTKTVAAPSAGFVKIMLKNIYNDTSVVYEEAKFPKPVDGHYIIALNSGEGCPGGITVNRPWSMTQKSSEGMVGATPQMNYFVQSDDEWYSNEPGLIYGYDPVTCPDRSGITAQIMINGPFVRAVQEAADVVPVQN